MERVDLLQNRSIFGEEDFLFVRGSHRGTHTQSSFIDYNDYLSVPVHVCGKDKPNVTHHMRYRRYFLMCMVILAILLLLYIPVYHHIIPTRIGENTNSASLDVVASIPGWSYNTSRELSTYVKPNSTAIHEPSTICTYKRHITNDKPIFLMIVICSAVKNFEERDTIRSTWGNMSNFDYPSYIKKRAAVSKMNLTNATTVNNDITASESNDPISNKNWNSIYRYYNNIYHYKSDINKNDLKDNLIVNNNTIKSSKKLCEDPNINAEISVKVLFLLGLPHVDNDTDSELQRQVDIESEQHQDIIQENFIDSYNNLTLKSVLMLKWVSSHCSQSVKYLMKADDDMFVNVNKLVYKLKCIESKNMKDAGLANHSNLHNDIANTNNATGKNLLLGCLIKGARPIADTTNKWYSPQYMYSGKVYPPYLSGTGYVMSINTVNTLYQTALITPIFHLEDIYITGICAYKAKIRPQHSPLFSYQKRPFEYCEYSHHITSHELTPLELVKIQELFTNHTDGENEQCFKKTKKTA